MYFYFNEFKIDLLTSVNYAYTIWKYHTRYMKSIYLCRVMNYKINYKYNFLFSPHLYKQWDYRPSGYVSFQS